MTESKCQIGWPLVPYVSTITIIQIKWCNVDVTCSLEGGRRMFDLIHTELPIFPFISLEPKCYQFIRHSLSVANLIITYAAWLLNNKSGILWFRVYNSWLLSYDSNKNENDATFAAMCEWAENEFCVQIVQQFFAPKHFFLIRF